MAYETPHIRVSSLYRGPRTTGTISAPSVPRNPTNIPPPKPKVRAVLYNYVPDHFDEIELRVGDQVQLLIEYNDFLDGWSFGTNLSTGRKGVFPLDCLIDVTRNS
ncbi:hypothetical protein HK100_012554 [Physocladia obscura]|uniref:SH3 domain-containing protein n=1 Tax=Physocladia obscura TaxID=109957 RepID=A0AAD5T266_9FUNG|nr:hypothetical protein HK100_012554 [Physocladia obscura]